MRRLAVLGTVGLALVSAAQAQDTAYKALRAVGAQKGEKSLDRIVAITGRSGHPQPLNWTVLVDDPAARGGVREYDIVANAVSAERTPVRRPAGAPINLSNLNVDSDGAFGVAEAEARRNHVGFDVLDYTLSTDPATGAPVWTVTLLDNDQRNVGVVRIGADNGNLLSGRDWAVNNGTAATSAAPPSRRSEDAYIGGADAGGRRYERAPGPYAQVPPPAEEETDARPNEGLANKAHRYGDSVVHFGQRVVNKTERAGRRIGGWFQKKFTGRDTISPDAIGEGDQETPPPPATDPYSQPVRPVPGS